MERIDVESVLCSILWLALKGSEYYTYTEIDNFFFTEEDHLRNPAKT